MPQPVWPSVEHQLVQSNVIPGSALEKLIRDNQDFHLLRSEEATDKIGLPQWLRVYWRKQHPEVEYRDDDPTGGYPRVLRNLHAWMLTHQDLQPDPPSGPAPPTDIAPTRIAETEPAAPMAVAPTRVIGTNLRISGAQTTSRSESDIRVNYNNASQIIAASNAINASRQAQFSSSDGGTTWSQTTLPLVLNDSLHSDPTVDWTTDGTAWATTIGIQGANLRLRAYQSTDGGATWTFDATFSGTQANADNQMM